MIPGSYDFTIYQGQTFTKEIEVLDSTMEGIDLTGYEAKLQIRDAKDINSPLVATLHSDLSQILSNNGAVGGTFTLQFRLAITDPIPFNATALQVKKALEKLPNIGANNIFSSGGPLPHTNINISFVGPFEHLNQPLLVCDDSGLLGDPVTIEDMIIGVSPVNATQQLSIAGVSGGTFTLTYKGQTTSAIAYNATNSVIQSNLQGLTNIGAGNLLVTGGQLPVSPVTLTFAGTLAQSPQPLIGVNGGNLLGGPITVAMTQAGRSPRNAQQSIVDTGATLGNFTLLFRGAETPVLAYNATASTIATNLQLLSTIGSGNVSATGGPLPTTPVVVTFIGAMAQTPQPLMSANSSALTGGPATTATTNTGVVPANSIQTLTGTGTTGTFTITTQGNTTGAIAANASAATIQTALQALTNVGATGVSVTGTSLPSTITITFTNLLGNQTQPLVVIANSGGAAVVATRTTTGTTGIDATQTLTVTNADGGSFTLSYNGVKTTTLPFDATAYQIQNALQAISGIAFTTLSPTGSPYTPNVVVSDDGTNHTANTGVMTIQFGGLLGKQPLPQIFATDQSFTKGMAVVTQVVGQTGITPINAIQTISENSSIAGSFTLSFNSTLLPPLPWNATASNVVAAFMSIGIIDINVIGGPLPFSPITLNFVNSLAASPQPLMTADSSHLIGGPIIMTDILDGVSPVNARQKLIPGAVTDGTFKLHFNGLVTGLLNYNATALEVETALKTILGSPNVSVQALNPTNDVPLTSGNFPINSMQVNFIGSLAGSPQPQITFENVNLTDQTAIVVKQPNDGIILIDPKNSLLTLKMFADKTTQFSSWSADKFYDLKLVSPDGDVERIFQGKVKLDQQVTSDEPFTGIPQPEFLPRPMETEEMIPEYAPKTISLRTRYRAGQ